MDDPTARPDAVEMELRQLHVPNVPDLLPFARAIRALDPAAAPHAAQVCGPTLTTARRLVAVAGSFNPPHVAHLALLVAGLDAARGNAGAFLVSIRTVDKDRVTGMLLEDRLWLLCRLAGSGDQGSGAGGQGPGGWDHPVPRRGVLIANRGLYVEQAEAVHRLCPALEDLVFVVGYDKIVQIFDPRYYEDREAALAALFTLARFLVAPRDEHTVHDVAALLERPENWPYAGRVSALPVDSKLAHVSSTDARVAAASGDALRQLVPKLVADFIDATGCYESPDGEGRYGARVAALANALASRSSAARANDA